MVIEADDASIKSHGCGPLLLTLIYIFYSYASVGSNMRVTPAYTCVMKKAFLVTIFPLLRRKISQVKGNENISEVTPLELKAAESSFAWD